MAQVAQKRTVEVERRTPSVVGPIFVSLAFHGLLLSTIPLFYEGNMTSMKGPAATPREKIMRVRFPDAPKMEPLPSKVSPNGEIVDSVDPNNIVQKAPDDARFLSDKNRAVQKQMQARFTGPNPTASVGTPGARGSFKGSVKSGQTERDSTKVSPKSLTSKNGLNLSLPDSFLEKVAGPKGTGGDADQPRSDRLASLAPSNYLPGIEMGNETLLNTREYVFSSFFVRMKRQMEAVWDPRPYIHSGRLTREQYVTVVQIILERDGRVKSARIAQGSGSYELDQEAIHAVTSAGPYLNPPVGLTDEDGLIQIPNWHFIVTLSGVF